MTPKNLLAALPTLVIAASAASAVRAQCVLSGPIGPGGEQYTGALAATGNAVASTVLALGTGFQTQTSAFVTSPSGEPGQTSGGAWARAIGGSMETGSTSQGTRLRAVDQRSFATSCFTSVRNDFTGFQGGIDTGRVNLGASGWSAHGGLTWGYFNSSATSQVGSGLTSARVPFLGFYGALISSAGWFVDAQFTGQRYDLNVSEPSIGAFGSTKGHGFTIMSSAGYRWRMDNFFVEPSVGIVYSKANIDSLMVRPNIAGVLGVRQLATNLDLGEIETLPVRASLRVGTTYDIGGVNVSPFASVGVWRELAGSTTLHADFIPPTGSNRGALDLSSSRVGTFGQYSLGFSAESPDSPWLGYARVDYRLGSNIESVSVNGGIRYQFLPSFIPSRKSVATSDRWSGVYMGAFGGGAWAGSVGFNEIAAGPGMQPAFNAVGSGASIGLGSSAIAGGTFGLNTRLSGSLIGGLEIEAGYMRFAGSAAVRGYPETTATGHIGDWYAVAAGRLGVDMGPVLAYVKAGPALTSSRTSVVDACVDPAQGCAAAGPFNPLLPPGAQQPQTLSSPTVAAAGGRSLGLTWAAGVGLEFAISPNWSLKGEYLALGTGRSGTTSGPGLNIQTVTTNPQRFNWRHDFDAVQSVKLGINYRFGAGS